MELLFDYYNYPIVPVKFKYGNRKTPVIEALLDSGGDFIVIPKPIATYLGLRLERSDDVDTAGGKTSLFKTYVDMVVGRKDKCSYYPNKEIYVSNREDIPVLLGRNPVFEDYEIIFKRYKKQLILKPINITLRNSYPEGF